MRIEFSIIIPVYKVEQFLAQCVDSVLEQTYKNYEIVLVDDGSPDNCPQICDNYADKYNNIKVVHKENGGLSDARNVGLEYASGEYVIFLDSDDWWIDKEFLQKADKFIECKKGKIDVLLFQAKKFYEKDCIEIPDVLYDDSIINSISKDETIKYLISTGTYSMSACTKILNKKTLVDKKIYFRKGLLGEDLDWFMMLIMNVKKIYAIDSVNYTYRIRGGSITQSIGKKNIIDGIWMIEKWMKEIQKSELLREEYKKYYYTILAYEYMVLILNYKNLKNKDRIEVKDKLKKCSVVLNYTENKRVKITKLCYKISGLEITSNLLNLLYKLKNGKVMR